MTINITEQEGMMNIALCGDLDNTASRKAEKEMKPVFEQTDKDVRIDCTELDYISSSGMRILLNIYKHQRANGHRAIISNIKEDVEETFTLVGFMKLFDRE